MSQRLGDLLVKEKIITPEQLQQAIKVQKETKLPPGQRTGQTGLPHRRGCHQFPFASVRRSRNKSFLL